MHFHDFVSVADIGARTAAAGTGGLRARATEHEQEHRYDNIRKAPFISHSFG